MTEPIDMVLHCPKCHVQHIDGARSDRYVPLSNGTGGYTVPAWTNPPHRSHLCHFCGHIWRPADVPTNGVPAVKTRGEKDCPLPKD